MEQLEIIEQVKKIALTDQNVSAALKYGSFTWDEVGSEPLPRANIGTMKTRLKVEYRTVSEE